MNQALPDPLNLWLLNVVDPIPSGEEPSDCGDCVMCPQSAHSISGISTFSLRAKCCTYLPDLPNFMVGKILNADDPVGINSLRDRMRSGPDATPLGLWRDAARATSYENDPGYMGRADLACPHYLTSSGSCAIWEGRNAVCSTWFCRHERGAKGHRWWVAARALLTAMEVDLSASFALDAGVPAATVGRLGAAVSRSVADRIPPSHWGPWADDPEGLYRRCWALAQGLTPAEAISRCGPVAQAHAEVLRAESRALAVDTIPSRLALGSFRLKGMSARGHLAVTYSPFDPVFLPSMLFAVLHFFDGRPTRDALQTMVDERGMTVDDALLRQLLDYGVAVPVSDPVP